MTTEQLPEGLQLALTMLEGDRYDFVVSQLKPAGLSAQDEKVSDFYLRAQSSIRTEHAQRLTLQHHAADQVQRIADLEFDVEAHKSVADMHKRATANLAQYMQGLFDAGEHQMDPWSFYGDAAVLHMQAQTKRIADLETKCATLKRLHDAAADERDEWRQNARNAMDSDLVQRAALEQEGEVRKLEAERESIRAELMEWHRKLGAVEIERDALRARLAEIEAQEPVGWQSKFTSDPQWAHCTKEHFDWVRAFPADWQNYELRALFTRPGPTQAVPDGWRPIETAPKDGSNVLVCAAGGESDVSHFSGGRWMGLSIDDEGATHYIDGYLTHWMPIPAAPEHKA